MMQGNGIARICIAQIKKQKGGAKMISPAEMYEVQRAALRFLAKMTHEGADVEELGTAARNLVEFIDFAKEEGKNDG